MYSWKDMAQVKQNLWNKLHSAKQSMTDGVVALAQIISENANKLMKPQDDQFVELESENDVKAPVLSQVKQKSELDVNKKKDKNYYIGISSVKRMNTQRTMILYFCILTVLMCCCLGRCLVVPLS